MEVAETFPNSYSEHKQIAHEICHKLESTLLFCYQNSSWTTGWILMKRPRKPSLDGHLQLFTFAVNPIPDSCHNYSTLANTKVAKTQSLLQLLS